MNLCDCGFEAKSAAGLSSHQRACRPVPAVSVLASLPEGESSVLESQARAVASALDLCDEPRDLPALSRELRLIMERMSQVETSAPTVDTVDELLERRKDRRAS